MTKEVAGLVSKTSVKEMNATLCCFHGNQKN
jgi:hypothetical protein